MSEDVVVIIRIKKYNKEDDKENLERSIKEGLSLKGWYVDSVDITE